MQVGVLALQGDFIEHQRIMASLGADVRQVRLPDHLEGLRGLVIPGGESTTIGKLAVDFGLMDPLREFGKDHALWGTCAGSIFLSKDAARSQPLLNLMDIKVARNAFGRQVDSFEIDLQMSCLGQGDEEPAPFHAIFIRAPLIQSTGAGVQVLASLPDGRVVAARQNRWLATSFHPELTDDPRFHQYFLEMAR
jgi:5'-phosphate synthase pdxT subunit